jgi:RNA polymerase-associated protein RTF1
MEQTTVDEDSFRNPYPLEGKYKDEDDRERLLNLPEIEREQVLYQRSEELLRLKEKRDLAALVNQVEPRRSGREGQLRSEKAGKRDDLTELKKRREEKITGKKVQDRKSLSYLGIL